MNATQAAGLILLLPTSPTFTQQDLCRAQRERAERETEAAAAAQLEAAELRQRLQQAEAAEARTRMRVGTVEAALSNLSDAVGRLKLDASSGQ